MTTDSLGEHLHLWDQGAWCLAALALAARADGEPQFAAAARDVLAAVGLDMNATQTGTAHQVASQAAAALHITSALTSGTDIGWHANTDDALRDQGQASAQAAPMFAQFMLPQMGDLAERLATPGARMLDVGTGIAALAVGYAETFPHLQVLGLDVMDRALELAADTIAASPAAARVRVRKQDIAEFADDDGFDLAWIPAPFIPPAAVSAGLPRVVAALRPGGWLVVGHGKFGDDGTADAINRLKTIAFGGTVLDATTAHQLLRSHRLTDIRTLPTPPGAPAITVGRHATSP